MNTIQRKKFNSENLQQIAAILKAVAHPVRLDIVQLLEENEKLSVNHICDLLDKEQSLISHHLSNMKLRGVLSSRREGKQVFYSLKLKEITHIFDCFENCGFV